MNITTLLGLGKPLVTENYDITVHNTNSDKIDTAIDADRTRLTNVEGRATALEAQTAEYEAVPVWASAPTWTDGGGGYTVSNFQLIRKGFLRQIYFRMNNGSGGTLAAGNIADTLFGTITSTKDQPKMTTPLTPSLFPGMQGYIGADGKIMLSGLESSLANGGYIFVGAMYIAREWFND